MIQKNTVMSWIGGVGLGMAFATGGWAMAVQKDIAHNTKSIAEMQQPFIGLRIEIAALRAEVTALTRAMEKNGAKSE